MSEARISPLYESFESALETGAIGRSVETALQIEEATPATESVVSEFADALAGGETGKADTLLRTADRRFDQREADEGATLRRSIHAKATADLSGEQIRMLTRHARQAANGATQRANFLAVAGGFLHSDASESDREEAVRTAQRTRVAEETAARAAQDGRAVTDPLELPGRADLLALGAERTELLVGRSTAVTATVGNVGDAPVEGVSVSLSAPEAVSVSPERVDLGRIGARERATAEFEVSSETAGDHALGASLSGTRPGPTTDRLTVRFVETMQTFAAALDEDGDRRLGTDEIQRGLQYWANDEPVPDTGGRRLSTEDLRQLMTTWADDRTV